MMGRKQVRYLNFILTVNAVLLACFLWAHIADRPILSDIAEAQVRTARDVPAPPNAAEQRAEMIKALRQMNKSMNRVESSITSGSLQVKVTNLDEIDIEVRE